jgi:hypothetical protein
MQRETTAQMIRMVELMAAGTPVDAPAVLAEGRFLQSDPVYGGSATAYDYANQDPVNQYELSGQASCVRKKPLSFRM